LAFISVTIRAKEQIICLLQPSQSLPRIFHLSYPRISVLPEGEEFLLMPLGNTYRFCKKQYLSKLKEKI
jgi:hypothetical protein